MNSAQQAAGATWVSAAAFGAPTIPVGLYLLQRDRLPTFMGLFPMYGGPWSERHGSGTFVALLLAFLGVMLMAAWAAWQVWNGSRRGAVLSLILLPVEAIFWIGFALPIPWILALTRTVLLARAWKSLASPGR